MAHCHTPPWFILLKFNCSCLSPIFLYINRECTHSTPLSPKGMGVSHAWQARPVPLLHISYCKNHKLTRDVRYWESSATSILLPWRDFFLRWWCPPVAFFFLFLDCEFSAAFWRGILDFFLSQFLSLLSTPLPHARSDGGIYTQPPPPFLYHVTLGFFIFCTKRGRTRFQTFHDMSPLFYPWIFKYLISTVLTPRLAYTILDSCEGGRSMKWSWPWYIIIRKTIF